MVTSTNNRLAQVGIHLVAIVGLISKNFCTAYLGQVFSLDGNSSDYPPLSSLPSGGPPFHPNCSKSTRAFVVELASEKQLTAADGIADEASFRNVSATQAQRNFKDLQAHAQIAGSYQTTGTL